MWTNIVERQDQPLLTIRKNRNGHWLVDEQNTDSLEKFRPIDWLLNLPKPSSTDFISF